MKSYRDNISRFLLFCGVIAPVLIVVIIAVVGLVTPGYNPVSETISQMGTPDRLYAIVLNGGYVIYGILIAAAAYGVYRSMSFISGAKILVALLVTHAIGTILLGVFPDTLDVLPKHFTDDLLHNTVSAISYISLLVSILVFYMTTRQIRSFRIAGVLGLVVVAVNLFMPAPIIFNTLKPVSGLWQRLMSGISFFWLLGTLIILYRNSVSGFIK